MAQTQLADLTHLPPIFLAYPSEKQVADRMTRLARELEQCGARVTTWQAITNPGFLFEPIRTAIDGAGLLLAEITFGNPNVLFEVGYAIAKGKVVLQMEDENAARPRKLPPLDVVRKIIYSRREDITTFLAKVNLSGPALARQMGLGFTSVHSGGLYFIPSRRAGDLNDTLWQLCGDSPFDARTVDVMETDYDSLTSQARSVAEADVFLTVLVSQKTKEYWDTNAELMLFAGLAAGLNKDFSVVVQQPLNRLLDLEDHLIACSSESEASFRVGRWLKQITTSRLRSPQSRSSTKPDRSSPLTGLFLGSLDARMDFELSDYFLETPEYQQAVAGQRHLFVGSKGSGKTANYEVLRGIFESRNESVVSIAPRDFEFPHLAAVFAEHLPLARWEFVYGSFWRFILLTEIMRSIEEKFLDHLLREAGGGKVYAQELLRWFEENRDALKLDFVSRVNDVLGKVRGSARSTPARRAKLEKTLQAARLYDIERHLKEFTRQFHVRLLIDDLDRNWSPINDAANRLIVSLLNVIQELITKNDGNLKPAVFVRKDVFAWLEEHDPEFLKRDAGFLNWNSESLQILIANRIASQTGSEEIDVETLWRSVYPAFTRAEPTPNFIISRTLLRPRDVIQFCQKAVEGAQRAGRNAIQEEDIYTAWESSGELILAQIETEYQHRYPGLGRVALAFFEEPIGQQWNAVVDRLSSHLAKEKNLPSWAECVNSDPMALLRVLYETGLVGVESRGGSRWFEADRPFDDIVATLADNFSVVVHPAFHRYLQCMGA